MPRGRPPKPTTLHVLEGTYREDEHGQRAREPQATGHPSPPEWLDELARAHWDAVTPDLVAMQVARRIDEHALAVMCDAFARWRRLREWVRGSAALEGEHAYKLSRLQKDWADLAGQFGLTPSARARIASDAELPEEAAARFVV